MSIPQPLQEQQQNQNNWKLDTESSVKAQDLSKILNNYIIQVANIPATQLHNVLCDVRSTAPVITNLKHHHLKSTPHLINMQKHINHTDEIAKQHFYSKSISTRFDSILSLIQDCKTKFASLYQQRDEFRILVGKSALVRRRIQEEDAKVLAFTKQRALLKQRENQKTLKKLDSSKSDLLTKQEVTILSVAVVQEETSKLLKDSEHVEQSVQEYELIAKKNREALEKLQLAEQQRKAARKRKKQLELKQMEAARQAALLQQQLELAKKRVQDNEIEDQLDDIAEERAKLEAERKRIQKIKQKKRLRLSLSGDSADSGDSGNSVNTGETGSSDPSSVDSSSTVYTKSHRHSNDKIQHVQESIGTTHSISNILQGSSPKKSEPPQEPVDSITKLLSTAKIMPKEPTPKKKIIKNNEGWHTISGPSSGPSSHPMKKRKKKKKHRNSIQSVSLGPESMVDVSVSSSNLVLEPSIQTPELPNLNPLDPLHGVLALPSIDETPQFVTPLPDLVPSEPLVELEHPENPENLDNLDNLDQSLYSSDPSSDQSTLHVHSDHSKPQIPDQVQFHDNSSLPDISSQEEPLSNALNLDQLGSSELDSSFSTTSIDDTFQENGYAQLDSTIDQEDILEQGTSESNNNQSEEPIIDVTTPLNPISPTDNIQTPDFVLESSLFHPEETLPQPQSPKKQSVPHPDSVENLISQADFSFLSLNTQQQPSQQSKEPVQKKTDEFNLELNLDPSIFQKKQHEDSGLEIDLEGIGKLVASSDEPAASINPPKNVTEKSNPTESDFFDDLTLEADEFQNLKPGESLHDAFSQALNNSASLD